jgi:hypothetical protein
MFRTQNKSELLLFFVLVIDIFVISICFVLRYSNFGFTRPSQMSEPYELAEYFSLLF